VPVCRHRTTGACSPLASLPQAPETTLDGRRRASHVLNSTVQRSVAHHLVVQSCSSPRDHIPCHPVARRPPRRPESRQQHLTASLPILLQVLELFPTSTVLFSMKDVLIRATTHITHLILLNKGMHMKELLTKATEYSLRPKINAILGFKICPTKNATLTNQQQKTRESRSFSHKRQANC
jgi:hypothetical protein